MGIRKKWIMCVISLLVIGVVLFLVSWMFPVKRAVRIEDFQDYDEFILIQEVHYTGTGWSMIGNENGFFPETDIKDVELEGKEILPGAKFPENYNIFLCTVEYKGLIEHDAVAEKIEYYEIQEWVPVYPIVRNRILPHFFYPRSYMTKYDLDSY